jgi:Protein of unknown function (DUF1460)
MYSLLQYAAFLCRMKNRFLVLWYMLLCSLSWQQCTAQPTHLPDATTHSPSAMRYWSSQPADSLIFIEKIQAITGNTLSERTLQVAQTFLGTPYVSHTLEMSETEQVVVNLRALDCWTFVESCMALALTATDSVRSFEQYIDHIRQLRYRNGIVDGYGSRLHYFSEWVLNVIEKGYFRDITQDLGGTKLTKKIQFITQNPKKYPKIRDTVEMSKIQMAQDRMNAQEWFYIPKYKVKNIEQKIQPGDMIVITSNVRGLDVEHQGFAIRGNDGLLRILHASSTSQKVTISKRSLSEYLGKVPAMSGIMVLRMN